MARAAQKMLEPGREKKRVMLLYLERDEPYYEKNEKLCVAGSARLKLLDL